MRVAFSRMELSSNRYLFSNCNIEVKDKKSQGGPEKRRKGVRRCDGEQKREAKACGREGGGKEQGRKGERRWREEEGEKEGGEQGGKGKRHTSDRTAVHVFSERLSSDQIPPGTEILLVLF